MYAVSVSLKTLLVTPGLLLLGLPKKQQQQQKPLTLSTEESDPKERPVRVYVSDLVSSKYEFTRSGLG